MNLLTRGIDKIQKEGFKEFTKSFWNYSKNTAVPYIDLFFVTPFYVLKAKYMSPIDYNGIKIATNHSAFDMKGPLTVRLKDDIRSRFPRGNHEADELELVDKYLDKPYDLIDIGACTGFLTAYVENRFESTSNVVAVEANPDLISLLEETKELNGCEFDICHSAYHPVDDSVEFDKHFAPVSGADTDKKHLEAIETVTVDGINVQTLLKEYPVENPAIICDIEGAEYKLLEEEISVLEENCPLLIIEFHEYANDIEDAKAMLNDSSFRLVDSRGATKLYKNMGDFDTI